MKRTVLSIIIVVLSVFVHAKTDKKVLASVFTITTFSDKGDTLATGNGFYLSGEGEALAPYHIFKGASKAIVIDKSGKKYDVLRICGASDMYDVIKFTTSQKSASFLKPSSSKPSSDAQVTILTLFKKKEQISANIQSTTTFNAFSYYTLSQNPSNILGCPVINEEGEAIGFVQETTEGKKESYALDIAIFNELSINSMSSADYALSLVKMPKQLPHNEEQATSYLYLLPQNSTDSISYLVTLQDYIDTYPSNVAGYLERASYYAAREQYAQVETDYINALNKVKDKAEIHHNFSKTIYKLNMLKSYKPYKDWTLAKALSEAQQAYSINPLSTYLLQQADCQYAMKDYMEAYHTYHKVNADKQGRSSKTLFCEATALEMAGGDTLLIMSLLDSAVMRFQRPYKSDVAPYLIQRARHALRYGNINQAAVDYQDYEDIVGTKKLNDAFFFEKYQVERQANLYERALSDIDKCLSLNPSEYIYQVEKAMLNLHLGMFDEAIYSAQEALKLDSNGADAYKIIGIAKAELGNKAEAKTYLEKAIALGDEQANQWLKNLK
ncbi:MAG: hypothetical protein KBT27_10110 [Prevotellaceae bacterium]|nr:hypothetical protein [Candidatus Faecinaster equi]